MKTNQEQETEGITDQIRKPLSHLYLEEVGSDLFFPLSQDLPAQQNQKTLNNNQAVFHLSLKSSGIFFLVVNFQWKDWELAGAGNQCRRLEFLRLLGFSCWDVSRNKAWSEDFEISLFSVLNLIFYCSLPFLFLAHGQGA